MKQTLSGFFLFLFLAVWPGTPAGPGLSAKEMAPSLADSADEVLREVVDIRGLELKTPVAKGVKNRDEIRAYFLERLNKEFPREELIVEKRVLVRLGVIPVELDLYEFIVDLLSEQIAGFYDPYTATFYIADWLPVEQQKPVMAHEWMHALQDQYFDLKPHLERVDGNDDAFLGRSAVIEGEGLAIMLDYMLRPLGRSFLDIPDIIGMNRQQMQLLDGQFSTFQQAPRYLKETLLFPYTYGARFLQACLRQSGWRGVNSLYADFPASTEQILHPAKYLEKRDEPTILESAECILSGPSGNRVYDNVLGEFSLYLWLSEFLDDERARVATEGWDGDRIELFHGEDDRECLHLSSVWDSEKEAGEFFEALQGLIPKRYTAATYQGAGQWRSDTEMIRLSLQGSVVSLEISDLPSAGSEN